MATGGRIRLAPRREGGEGVNAPPEGSATNRRFALPRAPLAPRRPGADCSSATATNRGMIRYLDALRRDSAASSGARAESRRWIARRTRGPRRLPPPLLSIQRAGSPRFLSVVFFRCAWFRQSVQAGSGSGAPRCGSACCGTFKRRPATDSTRATARPSSRWRRADACETAVSSPPRGRTGSCPSWMWALPARRSCRRAGWCTGTRSSRSTSRRAKTCS